MRCGSRVRSERRIGLGHQACSVRIPRAEARSALGRADGATADASRPDRRGDDPPLAATGSRRSIGAKAGFRPVGVVGRGSVCGHGRSIIAHRHPPCLGCHRTNPTATPRLNGKPHLALDRMSARRRQPARSPALAAQTPAHSRNHCQLRSTPSCRSQGDWGEWSAIAIETRRRSAEHRRR